MTIKQALELAAQHQQSHWQRQRQTVIDLWGQDKPPDFILQAVQDERAKLHQIIDLLEEPMENIPDHPDIRSAELTGYPVGGQPKPLEDTVGERVNFALEDTWDFVKWMQMHRPVDFADLVDSYAKHEATAYAEWRGVE